MQTFKFLVRNLGPINEATFDAAHFNVLCGKNNTGKSFVIHTIYCLFSFLRQNLKLIPRKEDVDVFFKTGALTFNAGVYARMLNTLIAEQMPDFIKSLPVLLGKDSSLFKDTQIEAIVNDEYFSSLLQVIPVSETLEVEKGCKIRVVSLQNDLTVKVNVENNAETYPLIEVFKDALTKVLKLVIIERLPYPFLLTAERTGTALYGEDVLSYGFAIRQPSFSGISSSTPSSTHYPSAVLSELLYHHKIREFNPIHPYADVFDGFARVAQRFRNEVLHGTFTSTENGQLLFNDDDNNLSVKLAEASSSVRALVGMSYFAQAFSYLGAFIMIDEPELNLHPSRQRALVRILANMVSQLGIGVCLSTHSDIIIRELNTLLALKQLPPDKRLLLCKKHGYEEAELLNTTDVACGILTNHTIQQVDLTSGIVIPSFDDTIEQINKIQFDIMDSKEE